MSSFYTKYIGNSDSESSAAAAPGPEVLYDDTTALGASVSIGTLASNVGSSNSTLTVEGVTGDDGDRPILAYDYIRVNSEVMLVSGDGTALSGGSTTVSLTRPQFSTTAAAHNAGVPVYIERWGRGRTTAAVGDDANYDNFGELGLGPTREQSWWYPLTRALTEDDANRVLRIISKGVEVNAGPVINDFQIPVKALLLLGDFPHRILTAVANAAPRAGVEGGDEFIPYVAGSSISEHRIVEFTDGGQAENYTGMCARRVITAADRYSPNPVKLGDHQGSMNSSATALTLVGNAARTVEVGDYLVLGTEYVRVTTVSNQRQFIVARGQLGTSAQTHPSGQDVFSAGEPVGTVGNWMIGIYRARQRGQWAAKLTRRVQTRIELA